MMLCYVKKINIESNKCNDEKNRFFFNFHKVWFSCLLIPQLTRSVKNDISLLLIICNSYCYYYIIKLILAIQTQNA